MIEKRGLAFQKQNKVIRKVRKWRHRNPLFGHIGDEISKNRKKNSYWASTGHETQVSSKVGDKLSLPPHFFSWTPSTNHCCCYVYCTYKCSQVQLFFLQWANLIGPSQKKVKIWKLPKIEDSMKRFIAFPLCLTYIREKGRTLGKTYGIKVRCYCK
jgi:hypothetical protein